MISNLKRIMFYDKGMEFYNKQMYKEAIEILGNIIKDDSTSGGVHMKLARFYYGQAQYKRGILLFGLENFSEAADAFEQAIIYNPENFDIYEYLGICYNNTGKFEKAARAFENIILKEPAYLPLKLKLSIAFHNLKLWNKAESVCREILNIYPDYANVWFYLGLSLLGNGQPAQAVSAFEKALQINPQYKDAQIRLGMTHLYMKNFKDAHYYISQALEKNPGYPDLHYFMGIIYTGFEEYQKAIDTFEHALKLNPSFRDALFKTGILYYKTGRPDKAVEFFKYYCKLEPGNEKNKAVLDFVTSGKPLENILDEPGFITQAIEQFYTHIKIKPNFSEMISIVKSFPNEDTSVYEKLIPVISEAIEHGPQYPDIYCSLGALYYKLKQFKKAEAEFAKSIDINPQYIQGRIYYCKALEKQEKFQQALEQGRFLFDKNIPYPDFYCTMGKVYFSLNMFEQAEDIIKKALKKILVMLKPALFLQKYLIITEILIWLPKSCKNAWHLLLKHRLKEKLKKLFCALKI
ncbi:Tetratricopeptide repeat-containing protein [Desulfonema limicola]|uniref:Tetratricopeptide repeat-containing protein n=1 Tax=Desulfonema limicola TaxID=45656 RepID=A0A975GJD3_9BACT|nr:tetratricopeptide repeat protein [Desulfonema limicola]QTA83325.1 Tetratricopeptide repeat-containing protein [Desulfonema limicola]